MTMVNHLGPCYCSFKWFVMLMWNPFSLNLLLEGKQVHGLVVKYGMAASHADLLDNWDTSVLVPVCFHFFSPKNTFWKEPMSKACLAETKTQLFGKSCILGLWRECTGWERSSELHFGKSPCAFIYIHWTHSTITKLPFDKSKDKLHTIPHSSYLSALPSALSITNFQIQTQKNL